MAPRFPHPMPLGWFSVGRLHELTEPVTTVDAFGTQVVVWRDEDDTLHGFDPVCPHMGAHLGVGGEVVGPCLRCPFHHWEFDGDGANTLIPYAESINRKARVYAYPTAIANGHLLAWYHPDRSVAPTFAVPDQLGADMVFGGKFDRVVRSDVGAKIAAPFAGEVGRQFDQDIPIWDSKSYLPVPALAPSEKPVTELRKWAAQFYA